jgi:putative DNA primase/helicase
MNNGILDLQNLLDDNAVVLRDHTPSLISTIALPFAFDPTAKCPAWQAFLREIQPDEGNRQLLSEIFGYCLTYDTSQQKFFMFEGVGGNRKGVVIKILMKMLGEANVSSIPLESFAETHGLEVTLGKSVNIVPEIGELDRVAEGMLKSFTGGDSMHFNQKYKDPFASIPTAKLIITTNVRPVFRDRSEGTWRRLVLMTFPVTILEAKQNKCLADALTEELPGIFNWAVTGYKSLRQRGYFLEPTVCVEAKREFRLECNPAQAFLKEYCFVDPGAHIDATTLYGTYAHFCEEHGYKALNEANFGKEVRRSFPEVKRVRLGKDKDNHKHRPWGYHDFQRRI